MLPATRHIAASDTFFAQSRRSSKVVNLPNGSTIQATHTTTLPFESLSTEARKADVLPGLQPNSLVSVGKFANVDYTTTFHPCREGVTVHKKNTF